MDGCKAKMERRGVGVFLHMAGWEAFYIQLQLHRDKPIWKGGGREASLYLRATQAEEGPAFLDGCQKKHDRCNGTQK